MKSDNEDEEGTNQIVNWKPGELMRARIVSVPNSYIQEVRHY